MAIRYTRAIPVELADAPSAWHYNKLAEAVNNRLTNGVGDPTWRIFWYAHSLFRNVRNSANEFEFPAEDEWWKFYAFVDPERNPGAIWPTELAGTPSGANVSNPIMAFTFGLEGTNLPSESDRLGVIPTNYANYGSEDDVKDAEKTFPLLRGTILLPYELFYDSEEGSHAPLSLTENWEIAKNQRGAFDPATLVSYAPAWEAPRSFITFRYPTNAPFLKTYSNFLPQPDSASPANCPPLCLDCPTYPNLLIKFSPLKSNLPVLVFPGTCADVDGHVVSVYKSFDRYLIFVKRGAGYVVIALPYTDYIEGPYGGGGVLQRDQGEQLNESINHFVLNFKGSTTERREDDYVICDTGFDFQKFFTRQYLLSPSYGQYSFNGSIEEATIEPIYPRFEIKAGASNVNVLANSYITNTVNIDGSTIVPAGFVCAGYYIYLFRGQASSTVTLILEHDGGEEEIELTTDANGNAEDTKFFAAPLTGNIRLRNGPNVLNLSGGDTSPEPVDTLDLPGRITCEVAYLIEQKPEIPDAYVFLRFSAADDGDLGRGEDFNTPKTLSDRYFTLGVIGGPSTIPFDESVVNTNPIYDAGRLMVKDSLRMIPRTNLTGYEVISESGTSKSVFYFKRFASISPSEFTYENVSLNSPTDEPLNGLIGLLEPETTYSISVEDIDTLNGNQIVQDPRYGPKPVQQGTANYPIQYSADGSINTESNVLLVGQMFRTGTFITLTSATSPAVTFVEKTTDGTDLVNEGPGTPISHNDRDYRQVSWTVDGSEDYNSPCDLECRIMDGVTLVRDWQAIATFKAKDPISNARAFVQDDYTRLQAGESAQYRVVFGGRRINLNTNRIKVVKTDYYGTPPAIGKYSCGAGHAYLCEGREYIVGGAEIYGFVQGTTATSEQKLLKSKIWLVADTNAYFGGWDEDGNWGAQSYSAGQTFTCPAGVIGFTLRPPISLGDLSLSTDPTSDAVAVNGTTIVSPVQQPNIEAGVRYRVTGKGKVTYNEFDTPASNILCSVFDVVTGKGSTADGKPCCEFKGVTGANIATLNTGNEILNKISQRIVLADGIDQFQGLGPSRDGIAKIQTDAKYIVKAVGTGRVNYNGVEYINGQQFTGVSVSNLPVETFTPIPQVGQPMESVQVYEFDGIRNKAPMKGYTNQWSLFTTFNAYHWSESSIWKPTAYGDILGFLHNRCNLYSPDWTIRSNSDLLRQFAYGEKPVVRAETPSGYTYIRGTNNPLAYWDLQTRNWYYRSCQVYKPDIRVERAEMTPDATEIKIVMTGRLQNCCNTQAAGCGADIPGNSPCRLNVIPRNYYSLEGAGSVAAFDARINILRAEPFKTDENSVLEYIVCLNTGCEYSDGSTSNSRHCQRNKLGDGAPGSILWGLPDDPFGSCFPRFYFTKLVPYVWPYNGTVVRSTLPATCDRNTKLDVMPFNQMELYLRGMCGGFIDGRSTKNNFDCTDVSAKLYDYSFEQLAYQSLVDDDALVIPEVEQEIQVTRQITIQWPQAAIELEPTYIIERAIILNSDPNPNPVPWISIAEVANDGNATQQYVDIVTYRANTVKSISYRVSTLNNTEVTSGVETSEQINPTFQSRIVSWDTVLTGSDPETVGRDLTVNP